MRKCILVLGMHRSGTSASTGVLHMLGVNLGTHIMPPSADNPKGYFENLQVYDINEAILNELNSSWDDFFLDMSGIESVQKEQIIKRIQQFIKEEFAYSDVFAIKDPRICLLFPLWEEALADLGITLEILIPIRNPMEVAKSLKKRNGFSINKGLALWLSHFIAAERYSRKYKRWIVNFDSLVHDTHRIVREFGSFFGLTDSEQALTDAAKLIENDLVHHNDSLRSFSSELPSYIKEIFEAVFSNDDAVSDDLQKLETLYSEIDKTQTFFFTDDLIEDTSACRDKKQTIAALQDQQQADQAHIDQLQNEIGILEDARQADRVSIADRQKEVEELQGQLSRSNDANDHYKSQIGAAEQKIEALISENTAMRENLSSVESRLTDARNEIILLEKTAEQTAGFENEAIVKKLLQKNLSLMHLNASLKAWKKYKRLSLKVLRSFNQMRYMRANKDVSDAISEGRIANALEHFMLYGYDEVKKGLRTLYPDVPLYNEKDYLSFNADVLSAVNEKKLPDGFTHFLLYGHDEIKKGRRHYAHTESNLPVVELIASDIVEGGMLHVPSFTAPVVSIIIPAYNQVHYTYACIHSIIEKTGDIPYEIIVMDDNSPEESARHLDRKIQGIQFISNAENLGFLRNCNKGAALARGQYLFFLNNDTQVQTGWLGSLVELMESDETIGMAGSKLVYPDGRLQEAGGIVWNDASGWNYGRLDDPNKPEYNYVKEVDYISGAAIMIRTDLWQEIGGFDERFVPAYYEDTDLAFEVRRHGKKVVYQPSSVVVHFEGVSNGTDLGSGIKQYQVVNRQKFLDKWKTELEAFHYANAQEVFQARDRSRDKKRVLFVDHYLPHYDQDAGSKATYQYLKMMVSSGMNVKFAGDNFYWYPDKPYLQTLQQMGIEVLYGPWYKEHWTEWLLENARKFDYVILSRPHIAMKYIDLIKHNSEAKILYFGVDLHYLREAREYEVKKDEIFMNSSQYWKKIEYEIMEKADVSYFYSSVEIDEIRKNNPAINAKLIPLYIFDEFKTVSYSIENRKDIMFVGGFSHSPNIDAVLWFVYNVWDKVLSRVGEIKLHIIGSNPPDEIMELARDNIIVTGFVSDEELEQYFARSRMMVAPLRYGAGMKGKVVQAIYEGIPVVTTSIGAEGFQEPERYLMIADDAETFAERIYTAYHDGERLKSFAHAGNDYCRKHFSIQNAKLQMAEID